MPDIFVKPNASGTTPSQTSTPPLPQDLQNQTALEAETIVPQKKDKIGFLTAFRQNPEQITYADLSENDQIVLFLRRHFITNLVWIVEGIFLIFLPFLLGAGSSFLNISLNIPPNIVLFAALFYYFLVFEFFFLNFLNWFYNISLVTHEQVIDIGFRILVSKNVASTKIVLVEDVSLNQIGLLRSIFDYGDVLVQTAGTQDNFEFSAVPQPEKVVHIVGDLIGGPNVA